MKISKLTQSNFAQLERFHASGVNVMFMGPAGIGKTAVVEQYKEHCGLGYVEEILSQIEAVDVRGMMVPQRKADGGTPDTISTRTPLALRVEREIAKGHKRGIIFFDEYYQAGIDCRKAVTQFLTTRRIGDWELPEGWVVWGASNPTSWRAGTTPPMGHELTRWAEFHIEADPTGFNTWAVQHGVHHLYCTFAEKFPHLIFSTEPPKDRTAQHCNARSLMRAHALHTIGSTGNDLETDSTSQEEVAACIGQGAARELFGFLKVQDVMPSPSEMLANPETCKIPPPERLDARYASMMQAVHYASPDTNEQLFEFVKRLDKEMAVTSIKMFLAKDPSSVQAPNISKFIGENPQSVMALAKSL